MEGQGHRQARVRPSLAKKAGVDRLGGVEPGAGRQWRRGWSAAVPLPQGLATAAWFTPGAEGTRAPQA